MLKKFSLKIHCFKGFTIVVMFGCNKIYTTWQIIRRLPKIETTFGKNNVFNNISLEIVDQ